MEDCRDEFHLTRQEEEIQALEAIFGGDFEDVRKKDKWKIPRPPEILLHLKPQVSMSGNNEVHASLTLRANYAKDYPDSVPEFKLEDVKGLSDEVVRCLMLDLKQKADEERGEVMMYTLSEIVQERLHKFNKPTLSIFEENLKYKKEQKAKGKRKLEEIQKRRKDYQRREIEEEIHRRKEEEKNLKRDRSRKREKSHDRNEREHFDSTGSNGFDITLSPPVPVSEIQFNTKTTRLVCRGKCIDKEPSGCIVHIGIDKESGSPVSIHEWFIPCPGHSKYRTKVEQDKVSKYLKTVKAVEQELHSLMKLSHINLISYLAIRYTEEEDHIHVDVLQEFVTGVNLEAKINGNETVSIGEVRTITEQLVNALDYLHSHSVVHKNLKASSVYIDTRGLVRLTDYSIEKRLADLFKESHREQPGVTFVDDTIPGRNSKKGDILKLGMLLLSLIKGQHIKDYPPDIPVKLPTAFQDFLNKCLAVEDRVRMTASELMEHAFLKPSITEGPETGSDPKNGSEQNELSHGSESDSDVADQHEDPNLFPTRPQLLSRIHSEFEELQWLGKGGFGDVVQVRNKLDGRFYAIKRILLDPRRPQFNRKITREVKLLSRLNHENVVRYYNSWMETLLNPDETVSDTSSSFNTASKTNDTNNINSLGMIDDIENKAPPPVGHSYSDWPSDFSMNHDEDEEDDDDEDELFSVGMFDRMEDEEEESILFEVEENGLEKKANEDCSTDTKPITETTTDESSLGSIPKYFLYIQMEFCEESTLREAINNRLCDDKRRMWRLFRETLYGLVHIHEQGMIHRDLKPQNIFLDRGNHIKIGDFGLATSHTIRTADSAGALDLASSKSEGGDSALTGPVGTALYVAPELEKVGVRTTYNQKVDIYSLGIIFFEMSFTGLQTRMERIKVLGNMRLEEIQFPEDFDQIENRNEAEIIRWCLKHSPAKRPTAEELLSSEFVPPPALEKSRVGKYVRQALQDPHSTSHRLLMKELFNKPDNQTDDVLYDKDLHKFNYSQQLMQDQIHSTVISVMKRHGAVRVNPPLLAPRRQIRSDGDNDEEMVQITAREPEGPPAATFMDSSGTIVTLPYDLRVPFARYISRNGIYNLKRYAIEKVFRKVKIHRSHPREILECAFDIVTPTVCNLIPDAEGIYLVYEIISAFPELSQRSYKITVNHTILLNAIFSYSGIPVNKYEAIKRELVEAKAEKLNKKQLEGRLLDLPLTNQQVSTLYSFIGQQGPLSKIQALLKTLTRNKQSSVSSLARQGLHELEALRKNLESFGVQLPISVHLGFVHNLHHFSGVIFQVSTEIRKSKKILNEVIAAGGRYDDLIQQLATPLNHAGALSSNDNDSSLPGFKKQCAFGVSIAIDKIVAVSLPKIQQSSALINQPVATEASSSSNSVLSNIEVLVAVIGRAQLYQERIRILRNLWDAGIRAEMTLEGCGPDVDSLEALQEIALKRAVAHLVILKDKDNSLKVRSYESGQGSTKHHDKSMLASELVDYLLRRKKGTEESATSIHRHSIDHTTSTNTPSGELSQASSNVAQNYGSRRLNIEVLPPDKVAFNVKKRYETHARAKLAQLPILRHLSSKTEVYVLAVDLPAGALKTLVQGLEIGGEEDDFNKSVATVTSQLPKYKKYFVRIREMLSEARFQKEVPLIILYSYKDDMYRLLS